jgi:hypothetical protein
VRRHLRRLLAVPLAIVLAVPSLIVALAVGLLWASWCLLGRLYGRSLWTWAKAAVMGWALADLARLGLVAAPTAAPEAIALPVAPAAVRSGDDGFTWMDWNGAPWRREPRQ